MRIFLDVLIFILIVPILFILAYQYGLLDGYVSDDAIPADPFIRAELAQRTSGSDLSQRIDRALDAGNYDDAVMYSDIADYMQVAVEPGTASRLAHEKTLGRAIMRNTGGFFEGFVSGEGSDTASFMGAITSDLTVVGDVRDIGSEGTKLINGEDYSQLVLGLSVVGLAATTATVATGGGALPAKIGVSLLKVAKKAGTLTVRFTRDMTRLVGEAVNFEKLRGTLRTVNLADTSATRHAVADYANGVSMAKLTPVFGDIAALEKERRACGICATDEICGERRRSRSHLQDGRQARYKNARHRRTDGKDQPPCLQDGRQSDPVGRRLGLGLHRGDRRRLHRFAGPQIETAAPDGLTFQAASRKLNRKTPERKLQIIAIAAESSSHTGGLFSKTWARNALRRMTFGPAKISVSTPMNCPIVDSDQT